MNLCAVCGQRLPPSAGLCPQHTDGPAGTWAAGNRIMCDFFHRGIIPPRLSAADRGDDVAHPAAAA